MTAVFSNVSRASTNDDDAPRSQRSYGFATGLRKR